MLKDSTRLGMIDNLNCEYLQETKSSLLMLIAEATIYTHWDEMLKKYYFKNYYSDDF